MNKRIFSEAEQKILLENKAVKKCSSKSITYTQTFKEQAVQQYDVGHAAAEIFKEAGFKLNLIGREHPSECLRRWRRIVRKSGLRGLAEVRGRNSGVKKKPKDTKTDRLKWLEAEVKYLKAENAFLAQLRAKRAERYSGRNINTD
jgi:hypothetical protein